MRQIQHSMQGNEKVQYSNLRYIRNQESFRSQGGELVLFSGTEENYSHGVAIVLSKETQNALIGYSPINDRLMKVRLQAKPYNLSIIQCYAPTSLASDEEIETFYNAFHETLDIIPNRDIKVIMGDMNAKVGKRNENGPSCGKFGLGTQNERGEKLVEFCVTNNLSIVNTVFQHHPRHLYTWKSPDQKTRNQIDYIMLSCIKDTKTRPGADCTSDHQLLYADIKLRLKKMEQRHHPLRLDFKSLNDNFRVEVNNKFEVLLSCDIENKSPNDLWEDGKEIVVTTAKNNLRVKNITKKLKPSNDTVKNEDGKILCDGEDVKNRWKEYCSNLYAKRNNVNSVFNASNETSTEPKWPEDWIKSVFVPIPKKGDTQQCSNNRTIALISHSSKILLKIIADRMQMKLKAEIAEEQVGFKRGTGTRNQILNLKMIIEKNREHSEDLYLCFIDYTKAFDLVIHEELWNNMRNMGFPEHIILLLKAMYDEQKAAVRANYGLTDWFEIDQGVRQGCILSPHLFNLYSENVMRNALEGFIGNDTIGGRTMTNLRYADDVVLITNSLSKLQDHFTYLGAVFTNNCNDTLEIKRRIAIAKSATVSLTKTWKDKGISLFTKKRLLSTLVFSIAMYGAECWTLKETDRKLIESFELWCFRRVLRISWTSKTTNEDVLTKFQPETRLLNSNLQRKLSIIRDEENLDRTLLLGTVYGPTENPVQ
ncbi:uncharacterized protein LOC134787155 [Penaeus indicus]|uniref:uncharacterized protein LOC134787155 n=1 Tax=Penaeus indicus TaxID=29960 RepID=UPI00300CC95B